MSIFNLSVITCEKCIPHVAQAQHTSYPQNFLKHEALDAFFCKLGCELCCEHPHENHFQLPRHLLLILFMLNYVYLFAG